MDSVRFTGDYSTWDEALAASTGYYLPDFVERTRQAALKVKNGEAVYERDSVLFDEVHHSFPLLAGLLRAAIESDGSLTVLDFGGGFGTSYFQCRSFLQPITLRWLIVDQSPHVEAGKKDFESNELRFFAAAADALREFRPNVLLLSGVLQSLPQPYELISALLSHAIPFVIIDRTFFLARGADRLTVQHGPFDLYPGSYPSWFFSEEKLVQTVKTRHYDLLVSFDGFDRLSPEGDPAYTKGFIFRHSR